MVALTLTSATCIDCHNPAANHDGSTGVILWRVPLSDVGSGWTGLPTIAGSTVFLETTNTVLAIDLQSGTKHWQTVVKTNPSPAAANIVAAGGAVYIAEAVEVIALDAASGAIRWRFTPDAQPAAAQSAVDDHALYIGTRSHRVYALSPASGQPLCRTDIGADWPYLGVVMGLAVSGDTVYAAAVKRLTATGDSSVGIIAGLDRNTLRELWRVRTEQGFFGPFARASVVGRRLYIGTNDTYVYAVDASTGNVVWRTATKASIHESAACGQRVFANNLAIFILDAGSGRILQTLFDDDPNEIPSSGFAMASDRVVFSGLHGAYALACQ
jgi:outer membrane protein assembly factor BamB